MRFVLLLLGAGGCAFTARGADMYRDDTASLLDTRGDEIEQCYDEHLKSDAKAAGTVTVRFVVAKKTGELRDVAVLADKTTAPEPLQKCVLGALDGIKLAPPDDRTDGDATFTWEFVPTRRGRPRS
jgi:hypothetical protein